MAGVFRPSVLLAIICFYRVVLSDEQKRDSLQCNENQKPCLALKRCILKADTCPQPTAAVSRPPGANHSHAFSRRPLGANHSHAFSRRPPGANHTHAFSRRPPGANHTHAFSRRPPGANHTHAFSRRPPGANHTHAFSRRPPGANHTHAFSRPPGDKRSTAFSRRPDQARSTAFSRRPDQARSTESSRKPSGKPGGKEVCPDGQSDCVSKPSGRPPKKGDHIFIGSIFPNQENPGKFLKDVLKDLGSSLATVEGVLNKVNGTWQVRRLKPDARKKIEWVDLSKGMKISGKEKLRFKPSDRRAHGFDGIELKIKDASKYIGILVNPCVVPKLVVKKKVLSGTEDTLLIFHLDKVVNITRARSKALRSKLVEEYKHAIPKVALDEYERLLKQPLGRNLGLLVWPSRHGEVEERSERSKDESKPVRKPPSRDRIMERKPKIFPSGSSLVFKPNDDYFGTVELNVVPVDVSPNIKDLRTVRDLCAFGNDSIISIEIANVNDKPTARRDPSTRNKPLLVVSAPPLPYELKKHSDNEGFKVGDLAMRVGEDKDRDRLGIAVVWANKKKKIGEWQYFDSNNTWQTINASGRVNDDASIVGESAQLLFSPPGQRIRFKPSELTKLWSATEQMLYTGFGFIFWDKTNDLKFGFHNVTLKGNSAISAKVITCTIGRNGCDGEKNSRKKKNECGKCGEKSCRKCDGDLKSSAKLNACGHCVLGKTGMGEKYGMDCMGICNGTYIKGKCGKCRKPRDVTVDCAGTCGGAAKNQKCGVCSEDEDAGKDACGVCKGDNSTCLGCDGVPNSRKVLDVCKVCRSPKSPDFDTGCVSIGHVSPKSFAKGVEQELKVYGAGFPKQGELIECELQSSGIKVTASRILFETSKSLKLSMPAINDIGKYKLSCTIDGVVYTKENFTVAVYDKQELTVTKVEPNEIDMGSGVTEVLVTGTGFMDTGDLFCVYKPVGEEKADVTVSSRFRLATKAKETFQRSCEKPPKTARAKFISSTQVKCKVSAKTCPGRVNISVVLSRGGRPDSSVPLTWYARAPAILRHFMGEYVSTRIHIIFNRSVAKVVGCDKIFTKVTVTKLAELADKGKPICCFRKPEELVITWRGEDMKTDINLKFKRGVIKANAAFSRTSPLELTVQAVVRKVVPIAVITAPSQVALCGKIKFSAKNSKKTGRKVFRCKWTVNVSNEDALNEEAKTDLANVRKRARGCVFTIRQYLKQGIQYTFNLVVESMGVESKPTSHVVERLEKNVPSVRFVRKLETFDMSKRRLTIRVRAKKPNCLRDSAVKFLWRCTSHPDLELGADNKNFLSLPRKRLECGTTYVFDVRVFMASNTQLFTVLTHSVTTKGAPLKFIIDGGDRVIAANDIIRLKARPVNRVTCGGKLVYVFSCTAEDGEACLITNSQGERKSFEPRGGEKPYIRVNANQFRANETYTFKVEVWKTGKRKTEFYESSVKITIVSGSPPTVRLETSVRGEKTIIIAKVKTSFKKTRFKWECVEESGYGLIDLSNMKRVKGVINRPEGRGQNGYTKKLLLWFDSTALEGVYKFRLIAYPDQALDNVGESTVTITTNAPPTQGELNVEPKEGESHNTTFFLAASNFYSNSTLPLSYKFSHVYRDKSGAVKEKPLPFNKGELSTEVQLPSGDDADNGTITLVVEVRDEKGATTSARSDIKCRRKQLSSKDVDKQIDAITDLIEEGDPRNALALGVALTSDDQPEVQAKNLELQESLKEAAKIVIGQAVDNSESKVIMELVRDLEPPTEESKRELSSSVTDLVNRGVPKGVERQSRPEQTEEKRSSRRRRAAEDESNADEEDEESSGMTSDDVENVLATFENLVDTTVVNNVTQDFLETVDNLLIGMCQNLPLGETSIALSALGTLRSDMNYMDDVDQVFQNVSCSNCSSLINRTALVKLGSELKSLYNEWNCSGGEELCNGVCAAMVQYPYDFITADNSSTRRSDVVFMELKNPETLDHIPVEGLVQPAVLRIPLHPGSSENAGYQCKIWDNSVAQWSTSGCQKTQVFLQDETVFVDCNCSRLGFTVVHADGEGEGEGGGTSTTDLSTEPSTVQSSTSGTGTGTQTTESPRLTASVTFFFDVNYNSVVTDASIKDQLENTVERTLANVMHVDMSLILNVTISPGSIVVNFILLSPLQNPSISLNYSISQLQLAVNKGEFIVTLSDGVQITADNGTVGYSYSMVSGIQPDPVITQTKDDDEENSKLPLILGCVFGVLLLIVIVVFILYHGHVAKQSKVSHQDIRMAQPIENNCAKNTSYQGSVGKDLGRPVTPGEGTPQTTRHDGSAADLERPSTGMEETAEQEARRPSTAGSRVGSGGVRRTAELPGVE